MRIEVYPPDELRLIAGTELTETYARDQRTLVSDFFRAGAGMIVRVTTEVQIDEAAIAAAAANRVLSKDEVFDVMAQKNPNLGYLRDALAMQIEY